MKARTSPPRTERARRDLWGRSIQLTRTSAITRDANPLVIADGTLEALKWFAVVLMVLDHVNKFVFNEASGVIYSLGRLVMPVFGFVLMYRLSRSSALRCGVHRRVMLRLAVFGTLATPAFVALVGWWPLNILFMLLVATAFAALWARGGTMHRLAAIALFLLGGSVVEFWWFGLLACVAAWAYCRRPTIGRLVWWVAAASSLAFVNQNLAALAAIPLLLSATQVDLPVARLRWFFYAIYPMHLTLIWLVLS